MATAGVPISASLFRKPEPTIRPFYTYLPLSDESREIRLVTLLRGVEPQPIRCEIKTVSIGGTKKYSALSYMWGDSSKPTVRISINGYAFAIRENLWWALYNLRDRHSPKSIWIDAICINQESIRERNHQVRLMSQIFQQAVSVFVWVGLEDVSSRAAFAIMKNNFDDEDRPDWSSLSDAQRKSIARLLDREYWHRLWIIQEVSLAKKIFICCGKDIMSWECVVRAMTTPSLASPGDLYRSVPRQINEQRVSYSEGRGLFDPVSLLILASGSGCTDVRDKIYGLLGLIGDTEMPVTYDKSVFSTYVDTVKQMTQWERRILPFDAAWLAVSFSQKIYEYLQRPSIVYDFQAQFVQICCFYGDTIKKLGAVMDSDTSVDDRRAAIDSLFKTSFLDGTSKKKETREQADNVRRWILDQPRYVRCSNFVTPMQQICQATRKHFRPRKLYELLEGNRASSSSTHDIVPTKGSNLTKHTPESTVQSPSFKLYRGSNGQTGLVPAETRPDDIIGQFLESESSFVLRRLDGDGGQFYDIVGSALVTMEPSDYAKERPSYSIDKVTPIGHMPQRTHLQEDTEYLSLKMDFVTLWRLSDLP